MHSEFVSVIAAVNAPTNEEGMKKLRGSMQSYRRWNVMYQNGIMLLS